MRGIIGWRVLAIYFLFFGASTAYSQKENYPKNYFSLPVYPGKPNTLSGALGDLRASHFHAGIDVRTQRREGLPITAAAEGYISRIIVQRAGYGKALYVTHPNGMTTVYAHLQKFNEEIGAYVREEQYKNQTFEISLTPEAGRFPVKREQLIAISGNTGSSEGPHLHFEIRDVHNHFLNPLFFGFPEIKDNTPPRFIDISLAPADINSRVNGRIDRQVFTPIPTSTPRLVTLKDTIRASGTLLLELQAFDRMDGTGFNYGLNCIEVKVDGEEVFVFNMEKFPVDLGRDYHYLINYKARVADKKRYYKCYNPDKNTLNIYKTNEHRGKLKVQDDSTHLVQIRIYDSFENSSELKFFIKGENVSEKGTSLAKSATVSGVQANYQENFIKLMASERPALFFVDNHEITAEPAYSEGNHWVYLWGLHHGLPDSVRVGGELFLTGYKAKVPPALNYRYESGDLAIDFTEKSLFDTLYLYLNQEGNLLKVNDYTWPLRNTIEIRYKVEIADSLKGKTHIYRRVNGRDSFLGGQWKGDQIHFTTRELGEFLPLTDTIPPRVRLLECHPGKISARISDELSGISSFKAKVDGQWVLMNYEYKNNYIWSEKLDESVPFSGELELEVRDNAGNIRLIQAPIVETKSKRR